MNIDKKRLRMDKIESRINISLILLLVISILFSGYVCYNILDSKNDTSYIRNGDAKVKMDHNLNIALTAIFFLLGLLILTISVTILKLKHYVEIKQNATHDQLTKLANRHSFLKRFDEELERCNRFKHPLSIIMLDLDNFKNYNDKFGHNKGDVLLKSVASIMEKSTRKIDTVSRWGGEEFIILLPETKGRDAYIVAERIRSNIIKQTKTSASLGLVYYKYYYPTTEEIIEKADKLLYKAKSTGKNKICYK